MPHPSFIAAAILAAVGMMATTAAAAPIVSTHPGSAPAQSVWDQAGETVHKHRRHGWDRGWSRHRHRDRVDAGDVIAGVLILGGIAAVVDAVRDNREREAHNRNAEYRRDGDGRNRDWRDRDWRDAEWPPRDTRFEYEVRGREVEASGSRSALQNAADLCSDTVEREARIDAIDAVERTASGWQVRGTLRDGASFVCQVSQDGRVTEVDYSLRRDRPVFERGTRD